MTIIQIRTMKMPKPLTLICFEESIQDQVLQRSVVYQLSAVSHPKLQQQSARSSIKKQYISYGSIIYSFLLRLVLSGNHTHSTTFQIMDPVEKEVLIIQLKARGGQEQLVMFLTGFVSAGKVRVLRLLSVSTSSFVAPCPFRGMIIHFSSLLYLCWRRHGQFDP